MDFVISNWYLFVALFIIMYMLFGEYLFNFSQGIKSIDTTETVRLVNREHAIVLHVTNEENYKSGHIPGAVQVAFDKIKEQPASFIKDQAKPVILSTVTSADNRKVNNAAAFLRKQGYASVYILRGGLDAWQRDNLPIER